MEEKKPTSNYLDEESCENLRKVLREGLELEEDLNETKWMNSIFDIIDNAIKIHCRDCPDKSSDDERGSRIPWEDLG